MTYNFIEEYDIIVIGAGHAGVEASLAASRMGCKVYLQPSILKCWHFYHAIPQSVDQQKGLWSVR